MFRIAVTRITDAAPDMDMANCRGLVRRKGFLYFSRLGCAGSSGWRSDDGENGRSRALHGNQRYSHGTDVQANGDPKVPLCGLPLPSGSGADGSVWLGLVSSGPAWRGVFALE